jgi:hypothetical protein
MIASPMTNPFAGPSGIQHFCRWLTFPSCHTAWSPSLPVRFQHPAKTVDELRAVLPLRAHMSELIRRNERLTGDATGMAGPRMWEQD